MSQRLALTLRGGDVGSLLQEACKASLNTSASLVVLEINSGGQGDAEAHCGEKCRGLHLEK